MMNLRKLIFTNNACYKTGRTITPRGIMVHSTGANNPNLKRYVGPDDGLLGKNQYNNHWNQDKPDGRQVCVHGFIGKLADGSIATYQTLPWNHRGWHCGSGAKGSGNDTHISFEICEDGLTDASYFNAVYKEAAELCAYLCKEYKLDPMADGVIIGHFEGYRRGIASNHGDPNNWFPKHGKSMDIFRTEVKKLLMASVTPAPTEPKKLYRVQIGAYSVKANADTMLKRVKEAGFTDAFIKYNVFFEDQGINSISEEGELMLTLLASQAQEESLSCSENCKWRIRKDFEQGQPNTCTMLGYRLVNGEITLVPEEAKIVKEIFGRYLSGWGIQKIANALNERGVCTKKIPYWYLDTVRNILRNEKYMGDLLLQKSISESHLTKRQIKNEGQLPQYYITDDHEPIVSRESFAAVQEEAQRRAEKHKYGSGAKSIFTGKIQCSLCGKNYRRKTTPYNTVWCCSTFNTRGKAYCASKVIPEETLKNCIAGFLGENTFTEDGFTGVIDHIIVDPENRLRLVMNDGTEKEIVWKDRSRSESWTEEMREAARQKSFEGRM